MLNVVDDVTRECLRAVVDTSISGRRVVRELVDLIAERGAPKMIVSDNGTHLAPISPDRFKRLLNPLRDARAANAF